MPHTTYMDHLKNGMARLLHAQLAELYYCEQEMTKALEAMAAAARSTALRDLLRAQTVGTVTHARKLEAVFADVGVEPRPQRCRAMEGLLVAGLGKQSVLKDDVALDLVLVAQAERMELFAIGSYTNLVRLARLLGKTNVVALCLGVIAQKQKALRALNSIFEEQLVEQGS